MYGVSGYLTSPFFNCIIFMFSVLFSAVHITMSFKYEWWTWIARALIQPAHAPAEHKRTHKHTHVRARQSRLPVERHRILDCVVIYCCWWWWQAMMWSIFQMLHLVLILPATVWNIVKSCLVIHNGCGYITRFVHQMVHTCTIFFGFIWRRLDILKLCLTNHNFPPSLSSMCRVFVYYLSECFCFFFKCIFNQFARTVYIYVTFVLNAMCATISV